MRIESRARSRALQALYAWDLRAGQSLPVVAEHIWDELRVGPEERRIAAGLVNEVANSLSDVDAELRATTRNWRLERLGAVERSVLRLGAAELMRGETPPRVAIHEAVRLAERYGSMDSARFVNGVLDALARRKNIL